MHGVGCCTPAHHMGGWLTGVHVKGCRVFSVRMHLDGDGRDDGLRVHQAGVAQVVQAARGQDLRARLPPAAQQFMILNSMNMSKDQVLSDPAIAHLSGPHHSGHDGQQIVRLLRLLAAQQQGDAAPRTTSVARAETSVMACPRGAGHHACRWREGTRQTGSSKLTPLYLASSSGVTQPSAPSMAQRAWITSISR